MVKLTNSNYTLWKPLMEDLLACKDLYDPIESKGVNPDPTKEAEWRKLNRKAVGQIRQWIDHSVFHHVSQEVDAYELWKKLEDIYQAKTARNKALLMRRLVNLKLHSSTSVAVHTSEFQSLINQLSAIGLPLGDEEQALLLLSSLPDSWETLVVSLSNSTPKLTMSMVKDAVFNEEIRRKDVSTNETSAFITENRGRQRGRSQSGGRGQSQSRVRFSDGKKPTYKCYYCGLEGHIKKNCRKMIREQKQNNQSNGDGEALVTITGDVAYCSGSEETCLHDSNQDEEWVVDTAASYHVTPRRDLFSTYKAGDFGAVKMGNSSLANITGVGDIQVKTDVGNIITLKDVRHVPDIRLNLLSVLAFDKQGYESYFGNGRWKMIKGSLITAKGHECGTLYKTRLKVCSDSVNIAREAAAVQRHM